MLRLISKYVHNEYDVDVTREVSKEYPPHIIRIATPLILTDKF